LILLWGDQEDDWAVDLANASAGSRTLYELFDLVDERFWGTMDLAAKAGKLALERDSSGQDKAWTYELTEIHVVPHSKKLTAARIGHHPLRVRWQIDPPSRVPRVVETDALTLAQYFPSAGRATVRATLTWDDKTIPITQGLPIEIVENPDYSQSRMFTEWTEYAAMGVAALFASLTGLTTQYDATFGSLTQYVALFIWAAGAATGGNLFGQLGTTSAPGGRADSTLPARP